MKFKVRRVVIAVADGSARKVVDRAYLSNRLHLIGSTEERLLDHHACEVLGIEETKFADCLRI